MDKYKQADMKQAWVNPANMEQANITHANMERKKMGI